MSATWRDPTTPEQWQIAVDAAEGVLAIKYARLLGLIEGGGSENVTRCVDIIRRGAEQGFTPGEHAIREFIGEMADEADVEMIYRVVKMALDMSGNPNLADVLPFMAGGTEGRPT